MLKINCAKWIRYHLLSWLWDHVVITIHANQKVLRVVDRVERQAVNLHLRKWSHLAIWQCVTPIDADSFHAPFRVIVKLHGVQIKIRYGINCRDR